MAFGWRLRRPGGGRVTNRVGTIGGVIRELREARQMSLPQLARRSQMPRSHLWHLERGHNIPTLATLERVSEALSLGLNRFLTLQPSDILLEDRFIQSALRCGAQRLNQEQRALLLKTLQAAATCEA